MNQTQLEQLGADLWTKENQRRAYFNHLSRWLPKSWRDWPLTPPLTGIGDPRVDAIATRLKAVETKLWYDLNTDTFAHSGLTAGEFTYACKAIIAAAATLPEQPSLFDERTD